MGGCARFARGGRGRGPGRVWRLVGRPGSRIRCVVGSGCQRSGGQLANGYRGLRGHERGDGPLWRLTSDGRGTGPALERLAFLRSYLVDDLPPAASRRALNFISVGSRRSFASFLLVSGRGGCPQRPSDPAASPVVVDRLAPAQP